LTDQLKIAERTVPSNIARLCRAIAPAKKLNHGGELQQIVFYQSGVGTGTFTKYASVAQGKNQKKTSILTIPYLHFFLLPFCL